MFLFVNIGFPSTSFGVFQPYIVAVPGIGNTLGSFILAMRTFCSLVGMFLVGKYYQKLDCRLGVLVACLLTSLGFVLYGFADSFVTFCVGAVFAGLGYGFGGMVALTMLIGRWFHSHVGTAVGVATVGSGVACVVLPPIVTYLIAAYSLSVAFWVEAVAAAVVGVIVFALLRNYPQDIGREPYGHHPVYSDSSTDDELLVGSTKPLPTHTKHLLMFAMVLLGACAVDAYGYLAILMTSSGFDSVFAAGMISLLGASLAIAKFVVGAVCDAVGTRRGTIIFFVILLVGLVLCCMAGLRNVPIMAVGVVLFGAGMSLGTAGISLWSIDLSTEVERPKLIRDLQVSYATGAFLFNFMPGPLMDLLGTYSISYVVFTIMAAVCAIIVIGVYQHRHLAVVAR